MKIPENVGESGCQWLKSVTKAYTFSKDEMTTIHLAAVCLDRISEAEKKITEHGVIITDFRGTLKPNPACKVENDSKILFARLCREVGLFVGDESRLPRKGGVK